MSARIGAVLAALLLLAACGGSDNKDPRDGRVYIDNSNCLTGHCYVVYKVCLGPDLRYHDSDLGDRTVKDSPECEVRRG